MSSRLLLNMLDNPLFIAQTKRRLRLRQALPTLILIGALSLGALLIAVQLTGYLPEYMGGELARICLLGLVIVLLYILGPFQIYTTVADDQHDGLLDFHRAAPTTPLADCLGYLLGPAAREYIGGMVILMFLLIAGLMGGFGLLQTLAAWLFVLLGGLLFQAIALLLGLMARRKARRPPLIMVLLLCALIAAIFPTLTDGVPMVTHLLPFPALQELGIAELGIFTDNRNRPLGSTISLFGLEIGARLFTGGYQAFLLFFLGLACMRKLSREGRHMFSRPGGIAFATVICGLVLATVRGGFEDAILGSDRSMTAGYFLTVTALCGCVGASLAPRQIEYLRGLRRARRAGTRVGLWDDDADTWPIVIVLIVLLTVALIAAPHDSTRTMAIAIAMGSGTVALVCFANEYLGLAHRDTRLNMALLLGFLILVLPWLIRALIVGTDWAHTEYIAVLSPVSGVLMATKMLDAGSGSDAGVFETSRMIAVSAAATWVYAIGFLITSRRLRRRLHKRIATEVDPS